MTDNMQNEQQSPSSSSPLKWALNLNNLLEDATGNQLFRMFGEQEGGICCDTINFYFATEGLKQKSAEVNRAQNLDKEYKKKKLQKTIKAIFSFLAQTPLWKDMPENVREAAHGDRSVMISPNIFDQMQQDVLRVINEKYYRSFLQSSIYVEYVDSSAIERSHTGTIATSNTTTATSSTVSESSSMFLSGSSTLPTLHEEGDGSTADANDFGAGGGYSGLSNRVPISSSSYNSKIPMSLTKDALMATQHKRLERPPA